MYEKDKKQRLTVRVNQEQFDTIRKNAEMLGIAPSDFVRMLINSFMFAEKASQKDMDGLSKATEGLAEAFVGTSVKIAKEELKKEAKGRENDKATIDNLV